MELPTEVKESVDIPRFIVGMSRAGTTWLTKCFNEHPETAAFGETSYWGNNYFSDKNGNYDQNVIDWWSKLFAKKEFAPAGEGRGCLKNDLLLRSRSIEDMLCEITPPIAPGELFKQLTAAVARAEGKRFAIEKTPHHVNWIDRILSEMPDARFVVMIRDPYEFMLSYKHQGDRFPEKSRVAFHRLYHPMSCALLWRGYLCSAIEGVSRYPDQVLVVSLDEVTRDPQESLYKIQRFFLLRPVRLGKQMPPVNTSFPTDERPALRADDVFWMNVIAGRKIRDAGFHIKRVPMHIELIFWSVLKLPIWLVRTVIFMRKYVRGSTIGYLVKWFQKATK